MPQHKVPCYMTLTDTSQPIRNTAHHVTALKYICTVYFCIIIWAFWFSFKAIGSKSKVQNTSTLTSNIQVGKKTWMTPIKLLVMTRDLLENLYFNRLPVVHSVQYAARQVKLKASRRVKLIFISSWLCGGWCSFTITLWTCVWENMTESNSWSFCRTILNKLREKQSHQCIRWSIQDIPTEGRFQHSSHISTIKNLITITSWSHQCSAGDRTWACIS